MDLLALGNSAANFVLYCIMSTQVKPTYITRLNLILPVSEDDQKDAGGGKEDLDVHQRHGDNKTGGEPLRSCSCLRFKLGDKTRGLNISDTWSMFQGHIKI